MLIIYTVTYNELAQVEKMQTTVIYYIELDIRLGTPTSYAN